MLSVSLVWSDIAECYTLCMYCLSLAECYSLYMYGLTLAECYTLYLISTECCTPYYYSLIEYCNSTACTSQGINMAAFIVILHSNQTH